MKSPHERYNYLPRMKKGQDVALKENRELQTSTTLSVEFIDCVFKVRTCNVCRSVWLAGDD